MAMMQQVFGRSTNALVHLDVQKVTRTGLERYLFKYVAKAEPSFGLQINTDAATKYL